MIQKFKIVTPTGTGIVQYGEFMPNDGREKKCHCWWNGCGIGGNSDTIEEAKEYLIKFIKKRLTFELNHLEEQSTDIRLFLRGI